MNLLVVRGKSWALYDPTSMQPMRSGTGPVRVAAKSVGKTGIVVSKLPDGRGLAPVSEVKNDLSASEKALVKKLSRFQPLWVLSDQAFWQSLPIEVTAVNPMLPDSGLIHLSMMEQAAQALQRPVGQINLISMWLDTDSSVAALRGGVPVEVSGQIDPWPDIATWAGLSADLSQILSKPKLRFNPKFQLGWRIFLHQLVLRVGSYGTLLGKVDAVILSGRLGESGNLTEELLQRLPGLQETTILQLSANPLQAAAEILRRL